MGKRDALGGFALACALLAWFALAFAMAANWWIPVFVELFQANPLATIWLLLGLLWFSGILGFLALILGAVAYRSQSGKASVAASAMMFVTLLGWYYCLS